MWDEDPKWQQAYYKFTLWSAGFLGMAAVLTSLSIGNWAPARFYVLGQGFLLAVLATYATLVWLAAHLVPLLARLWRKQLPGPPNSTRQEITRE